MIHYTYNFHRTRETRSEEDRRMNKRLKKNKHIKNKQNRMHAKIESDSRVALSCGRYLGGNNKKKSLINE